MSMNVWAIILAGCIAFSLFIALCVTVIVHRARDVNRMKAREEAEMAEVIGAWVAQGRQAGRPARSVRRPYQMPTYPPDISFYGDQQITAPRKLKRR